MQRWMWFIRNIVHRVSVWPCSEHWITSCYMFYHVLSRCRFLKMELLLFLQSSTSVRCSQNPWKRDDEAKRTPERGKMWPTEPTKERKWGCHIPWKTENEANRTPESGKMRPTEPQNESDETPAREKETITERKAGRQDKKSPILVTSNATLQDTLRIRW